MEREDLFEVGGKGGCVFGEAVRDVGDEVDEVAEGDNSCGGCGRGRGEEDVSLGLVLAILVQEVLAV